MGISIVIPVHNEAENIVALLLEIIAVMGQFSPYEIIYVNDGSSDHTADILAAQQRECAQLRVIKHQHKCGQSAAIQSGILVAKQPYIATLDGDGQNDPGDILPLYRLLLEQKQSAPNLMMVAGWRQTRQDSTWKRFCSRFANGIRAQVLRDHTPDTGCGLKVFLRDAFLRLPYFDHMHRFLPALIIRAGGQVISATVNHRPRTKGTSKYGTLDRLGVGIFDLIGVMWLQKRAGLADAQEIIYEQ